VFRSFKHALGSLIVRHAACQQHRANHFRQQRGGDLFPALGGSNAAMVRRWRSRPTLSASWDRPLAFSRDRLAPIGDAAYQGEHNKEVCTELGFDEAELERLLAERCPGRTPARKMMKRGPSKRRRPNCIAATIHIFPRRVRTALLADPSGTIHSWSVPFCTEVAHHGR
jgi:hypothetical protein